MSEKRQRLDRRNFVAATIGSALAASTSSLSTFAAPTENQPPASHPEHKADAQPWLPRGLNPPLRAGLRHIFDPSQGEKDPWYINDHCFIQEDAGLWHLFGITCKEPANPSNEKFLLHATAPDVVGPWTKQTPVMHIDPASGETLIWAPHVIRHDGKYWMFYCAGGPNHSRFRIHLATSTDLFTWTRSSANPMVVDGYDARDPMVLRVGSQWVLYYCATESPAGGHHIVAAVTSPDLIHWTGRRVVFRSPHVGTYGGPTESPFVVERDGVYYLFLCTNDPYNNTEVYASNSPFHWNPQDVVLRFDAHAAEVVSTRDGRWFLSSAGWAQGGLYLADLAWQDQK